jgi:hypothetical protein
MSKYKKEEINNLKKKYFDHIENTPNEFYSDELEEFLFKEPEGIDFITSLYAQKMITNSILDEFEENNDDNITQIENYFKKEVDESIKISNLIEWKGRKEGKIVNIDKYTSLTIKEFATRSFNNELDDNIKSELNNLIIEKTLSFNDLSFKLYIDITIKENSYLVKCSAYPIIDNLDQGFDIEGFEYNFESKDKFSFNGKNIDFKIILSSKENTLNFYGIANKRKYPEELKKYKNLVIDNHEINIKLELED